MIRVVVALTKVEADYWIQALTLDDVALVATQPEQLRGVRADELHVVGRAPAQLPFEMHHAMTMVRKPKPNGRLYPAVIFH